MLKLAQTTQAPSTSEHTLFKGLEDFQATCTGVYCCKMHIQHLRRVRQRSDAQCVLPAVLQTYIDHLLLRGQNFLSAGGQECI